MTNRPSDNESLDFPAKVKLDALDPREFDAIAQSIVGGVLAERARTNSSARVGALTAIAQWSRPAFAAAAVVLIAAITALTLMPTPAVAAPVSFAESAGVSRAIVQWTTSGLAPTPEQLLGALNGRTTPGAP